MPVAVFRMSVETGERFKRLSRELKQIGAGDLKRDLNHRIRDAAKPVVTDVREAARSVQVTSSQGGHVRPDTSTGLRERVAHAVTVEVRQRGIRIKVSAKKMGGPYARRLPKYLDASFGQYKKWRHPVFADKKKTREQWRWVAQTGQPYFGVTIKRHAKDFRKAVLDAMSDVEKQLQ